MNPYEVLGVRRNASKASITKAFRRQAKTAHPDTGGDSEAFHRVHLAYKVLMDDARRAKYDATGEVEATRPDNRTAAIMSVLSQCLMAVVGELLKQGCNPSTQDVVGHIRTALQQRGGEIGKQRRQAEGAKAFLSGARGRFVVDDGENVLEQIAGAHLAEIERGLEQLRQEEEMNKQALAELKRCRFRFEAPRAMAGAASTTATMIYRIV